MLLSVLAPLLAAASVAAQGVPDADEVVTVNTRLVTVTARASGGRASTLSASTLRVLADDSPQQIAFADQSGASSVALLVDKSLSMSGEPAKRLPYAVETFTKAADPRNEYTLITFNKVVRVLGTFKGDDDGRRQLLAALARQPYEGDTALYDAFLEARRIVGSAPAKHKRALVVFTDAGDNSSAARLDDLRAGLDSIGGLTFVVVMSPFFATNPLRHDAPLPEPKLFESARLLRASLDGEAYPVRTKRCIADAAESIARDLRNAVQLAFYPTPLAGRAGVHALRVESTEGGLKIRARSRYVIQ